MSAFGEQFATTVEAHRQTAWEGKENPQAYDRFLGENAHPRPTQHMLGVVGGNEVGIRSWAEVRDIESDLRGITRANTFCPGRQHHPLAPTAASVTRATPKEKVTIKTKPVVLPQSQMWAYPSVLAPEPFVAQTCGQPWKY